MRMRRRKLLAAICALCLMLPHAALAEEPYVTWESEPKEGSGVEAGDTIRYAFTLEKGAQADDWTALRVQLGNGVLLQPETISITFAQQPSPAASASPEETPQASAEPEAIKNGMADEVQWEVIPGNDGFVILFSGIHAGDSVSFLAKVQEQGEVSAAVRTGTFHAAITHTRVILPTPSPAASITPAPAVVHQAAPGIMHILLAVGVAAVLALIGVFANRRFILPGVRLGHTETCSLEASEKQAAQPEEKEQDM